MVMGLLMLAIFITLSAVQGTAFSTSAIPKPASNIGTVVSLPCCYTSRIQRVVITQISYDNTISHFYVWKKPCNKIRNAEVKRL